MNSQVVTSRTPLHPATAGAAVADRDDASRESRAFLTPAHLLLPRLRYYVDLLAAGYRQAVRPEPLPRCLRAERIALGIDLPELDAGPLWACRGAGGTVSIPFADFVLGRIHHILGDLLEALPVADRESGARLRREFGEYRRFLAGLGVDDVGPDRLPRLEDCRLAEPSIDRLCGPGGLLYRIVEECENVWLKPVGCLRR